MQVPLCVHIPLGLSVLLRVVWEMSPTHLQGPLEK